MANNPLPYDSMEIAAVNARAALLNSGFLVIYTGTQPALNGALTGTLLAQLTFGPTAFPSATAFGGVVTGTANPITPASAAASGVAGYYALLSSDGITVRGTGSVGTSGADLNLSTLSITAGQTVSCSSYQLTQPEA